MKRFLLFSITIVFLSACKNQQLIAPKTAKSNVDYSLIYLIHADANYLYHDNNGKAHRANEKVLREAVEVGENAESGEVFIFHLKPETKILKIFPRKDRQFIHYRNGELQTKKRYSPGDNVFSGEKELLNSHRSGDENSRKVLLYFGHEIPSLKGDGYHKSRSEVIVNVHTFARGVKNFLEPDEKYELAVLSTCNNGNPQMAHLLQPFTNVMLASPQNLHLSHMDSDKLSLLETNPNILGLDLAHSMAESTFNRLTSFLQTTVTLTVYDLQKSENYLTELYSKYESYLSSITSKTTNDDNIDCKELSLFGSLSDSTVVKNWYRPSPFERRADSHSGWGCKQ